MENLECYEQLANAVVIQAAHDYRTALVKRKEYDDRVKELQKFFNGQDISTFTKLDGKTLAERIEQEVIDNNYDLKGIMKNRSIK